MIDSINPPNKLFSYIYLIVFTVFNNFSLFID